MSQKSAPAAAIAALLVCALFITACDQRQKQEAQKRVAPVYDETTGKLKMVKFDSNGDGTLDAVSYMDGARVVRIEIDRDQDGKIDRWEYYRDGRTLEKVGLSTRRDGKANRFEYYDGGKLTRADEDNDGDGKPDKWETYDGARLASVAFDTTHRGTPDRRLVYGPGGSARLEVDPGGTGAFVPAAAPARYGGVGIRD